MPSSQFFATGHILFLFTLLLNIEANDFSNQEKIKHKNKICLQNFFLLSFESLGMEGRKYFFFFYFCWNYFECSNYSQHPFSAVAMANDKISAKHLLWLIASQIVHSEDSKYYSQELFARKWLKGSFRAFVVCISTTVWGLKSNICED